MKSSGIEEHSLDLLRQHILTFPELLWERRNHSLDLMYTDGGERAVNDIYMSDIVGIVA